MVYYLRIVDISLQIFFLSETQYFTKNSVCKFSLYVIVVHAFYFDTIKLQFCMMCIYFCKYPEDGIHASKMYKLDNFVSITCSCLRLKSICNNVELF